MMSNDFQERVERLREAAEKANSGPWQNIIGHPHQIITENENWPIADVESFNDAAFIAAANPAVVLEFIEYIERLEEDFEAASLSAAEESVKAAKLEEEAEWLAGCLEERDIADHYEGRVDLGEMRDKTDWREAARKAAAEGDKA